MSGKGLRNTETAAVAEILTALGNITRLTLVKRLSMAEMLGGLSISELTEGTGLTRQAITKHLEALADVGLVNRLDAGRATLYELKIEPIKSVIELLEKTAKQRVRSQHKLKAYMEKINVR